MECGILTRGFARARCDKCVQDFLLAYSWKGRGVCAGCNTGRMVETAAHMVEHVFLAVAVRQWVVVFPKRGRYCLNIYAGCLNRVAVIVTQEVQRARGGASTNTAPAAQRRGVICAPHWRRSMRMCICTCACGKGWWRTAAGQVFRGVQVGKACVRRLQSTVRQRLERFRKGDVF